MTNPELPSWPSFDRRVEPLPGGVSALRRRLAEERARESGASFRWPWALAAAGAACGLVIVLLTLVSRADAGERALGQLLAGTHDGRPAPTAVALGLLPPPVQEGVADPRVPASDAVVFLWVAQAPEEPPG